MTSVSASSTRRSVSGRGISARGSAVKARPKNSLMPRMYATGSPAARRSSAARYAASASTPTGASGWARIAVRSTPMAKPSSSSASSLGDSDPAAVSRSMPSWSSAPTVLTARGVGVTAGS